MRTLRNALHSFVLLGCIVFLISCANQIPPQGGPIDTTPPTIISTYPSENTLHYSDKRLSFEFDKYVEHRSAEESIFISPHIADLEFDWSGKELEVTFREALRKNTTYVVNVGTDVRDLRSPPNRLAQAYTFAFSTGADIDRGAIRGKVFPAKPADHPEGVMIFAYQLSGINPDTLDPGTQKPDYITQTGSNGSFYLQHLAFGPYRIVAVRDEYRNLLYDTQVDEFGVPAHDFVLSVADTLQDDVLIQLGREDTTAPRLVKADPRDKNHVSIEFSEPIDTTGGVHISLSIVDTLSRNRLNVFGVIPDPLSLSAFTLVTAPQDSTKSYLLSIDTARDFANNKIDPKVNSLVFGGSAAADTLLPKIALTSIQDSTRGVILKPEIQIQFSDAVQPQSFAKAIFLRDTSRMEVPSSVHWLNDASCRILLQRDLMSKSWYTISILTENGLDWSGKKFKDSLKTIRFETLDAEALSSIEGIVIDTNAAESRATIVVTAEDVDAKVQKSHTTSANQSGNFYIGQLEEGRYIVHAYRDQNRNGKYDAGSPHPFVGSERFNYASDTLKVRARWPLEGVRIELK
jgi:uncharacterized protein (DUF2141 family)